MPKSPDIKSCLDRRFVYFCSVKGFYCGRAQRTQTILCDDCPAEAEEKTANSSFALKK